MWKKKGGRPEEGACESMRLSPCVLVQPDGWARGKREGYGEPCDVTSLSLSLKPRAILAPSGTVVSGTTIQPRTTLTPKN